MFDLVTKYKRVIQVFLGLIALTFATWGIESYTRFRGAGDAVASVNGMKISQREFTDELRRQQDQVRQMFGRAIDPAALDTPESRRTLLDSLIAQRLVASAALRGSLTVTDETLRDTIRSIPAFQDGGQFSKSSYELVLRSQNPPMSPAQFESRLRYDLSLKQLARAVGDSAIAPRAVAQRLSALESQKREVADARILTQQFLSEARIDEAKLKAHYDANQADFRTPERVRAEYLVLSAELLARQEPVTEEELKSAYEARAAQYRVDEQRRASHILVKSREEADKLLAELKESPGRFAELAKKQSQDPGSAAKGGDLGWFGRGMMVKPFDDAVFKLKQNDLQIVQSEFGYHVVRLTGIQAGKSRPFEEVRKELSGGARREGRRREARAAAQGRRRRRQVERAAHGVAARCAGPAGGSFAPRRGCRRFQATGLPRHAGAGNRLPAGTHLEGDRGRGEAGGAAGRGRGPREPDVRGGPVRRLRLEPALSRRHRGQQR